MNPSFPLAITVYFIAWGCSHHRLSKCLLDKCDTALVDRFTVRQEATLQSRSYRGQTLEGKKTKTKPNDDDHWEECIDAFLFTGTVCFTLSYIQAWEDLLNNSSNTAA